MKGIIAFLKRNGFKRMEKNSYANELCNVVFQEDGYEVSDNEGNSMYSGDVNIYWLIGVLTYYGYMDKEYSN